MSSVKMPGENHNHSSSSVQAYPSEPYPASYRWLVLGLVWLLYVCHGIVLRSPSPLITPMLKDLDMSYSQMGFVLGSWQLTYLVVAIAAGIILDKWGLRKSLFLGAIIIALSAVLRYFARGFGTLLPMVALFGVGGPMISIGAPKAIAMFFKGKDRGTAIGIYTTGPWVGQMTALAATNSVIMPLVGNSWRVTFVLYGLFTLWAASLWWFLANKAGPVGNADEFNFSHIIKHLFGVHSVRIILLVGILLFAVSHGFNSWLPKLLESSGLSPTAAGFYSSIPFITGIPAVLIIPRLTPAGFRGPMIALLALLAALTIILTSTMTLPLLLSLLLYGIAGGSLVPLVILTLMETPGVDSDFMGAAGGLFFCISEIGGFFGPFIIGYLVDLTGTFTAGAIFLALLAAVIAVLMIPLKTLPVSPLNTG
jgi:cyanate permease